MSRTTIPISIPTIFSNTLPRYTTAVSHTDLLEQRIAEIDHAHSIEIKHLDNLIKAAEQKILASKGKGIK